MADVNRGNRPLSPHLTIYRPQITSMLSILHRVTGVGLTLGAALVVWWLLAAATGEEQFDFANGILTSWIGILVWLGMTFALAYHFCNGIRHLIWDMGYGFKLDQVELSGKATVGAAGVLTLIVWAVAYWGVL
ncbi:MAG: succinate dehydrogenase, cytochrome b556 subunit [Pseudomonadota bacterium]